MNAFKVTFEDGNSLVTSFNGTLADANAYYLNNLFNFGDTEDHPKDLLVRGVSVEQVTDASDGCDGGYWCCKADFGQHEPTCRNYGK